MSIVHVKQIAKKIKTLFEGKIDLSDKSLDKEITFLTRGLAAYAVQISAQTSEIESAKAVVDGFDDNGIDAIYYSTNNKTLYLVQSKWIQDGNGEPSTGDVSKFITGIKDLINGDYDKFNQKVQEKQNVVQSALTNFGTKIECIIIYTGKENLGRHNKRIIETLENELNDIGENNDDDLVKIAQFKQINQSEIYSTIAQGVEGEPINLELSLSQWGKVEEPIFAYFGMVSGIEIKQWYKQYNTRLFNKNIRKMLGNTEVNKEIENTIQNQPDKFWYFNNGITLIANDVTKNLIGGSSRDSGYFNATNISIAEVFLGQRTCGQTAAAFIDAFVAFQHMAVFNFSNNLTAFNGFYGQSQQAVVQPVKHIFRRRKRRIRLTAADNDRIHRIQSNYFFRVGFS